VVRDHGAREIHAGLGLEQFTLSFFEFSTSENFDRHWTKMFE
jgi:hypothetical protein